MNIVSMLLSGGMAPTAESATTKTDETEKENRASEGIEGILGKDAFLELLITQLRYQDPMKPVEDQNFIAQMAQFSALEQTQNLAEQMEAFMQQQRETNRMAQATSLLGREVEVQGSEATYTGTVDAIRMLDGVPRLVVDNVLFEVSDVVKVLSG